MLTKFLNYFGIETKAQREANERLHQEILREARRNQARLRLIESQQARAVIRTTDVPGKRSAKISKPVVRPTQQVRQTIYGHDDYLTPGFNAYYTPAIVDPTVFMPAINVPVPEPTPSHDTPSYDYSTPSSDSGSSSSYDSGSSYSSSYDSGSYDSGSSFSSSDSGSW